MCVASGSALSIATFGLFPLAGLDVSPVANKPAAQSQVAILKVRTARPTALCAAVNRFAISDQLSYCKHGKYYGLMAPPISFGKNL